MSAWTLDAALAAVTPYVQRGPDGLTLDVAAVPPADQAPILELWRALLAAFGPPAPRTRWHRTPPATDYACQGVIDAAAFDRAVAANVALAVDHILGQWLAEAGIVRTDADPLDLLADQIARRAIAGGPVVAPPLSARARRQREAAAEEERRFNLKQAARDAARASKGATS